MIDYKISNTKGFRYIFDTIDNFSKYLWAIPSKNKYSQTVKQEFSIFLSTFKRSPVKLECDRGTEVYNSVFQNFLKSETIRHYPRYTDKRPNIAERVIRTVRNLLKKPVFSARNANWLSELPSIIKKYNNTIHSSIKMTPNQASKKRNEKDVYSNLQDRRVTQQPKFKLAVLVRAADIKRLFSKGD